MFFVVIDNEYFYSREHGITNFVHSDFQRTWKYSSLLSDKKHIEYAQIYADFKDFDDLVNPAYGDEWKALTTLLKRHYLSFNQAKINLNEVSIVDLLPSQLLHNFLEFKLRVIQEIFEKYKKPAIYEYGLSLSRFVDELSNQKLNITLPGNGTSSYIHYKINGTKTGRFSTLPNSFPILTLKKEFRKHIRPNNDVFLELDYNAADIRTFLGLLNKEQPSLDIYEWLNSQHFDSKLSRKELKVKVLASLYSENSSPLDAALNKQELLNKVWNGTSVSTSLGRIIPADRAHAIAYAVQASTTEIFNERMLNVWEYIKKNNLKSYISWCLHDSLTLDFCENEKKHIKPIIDIFESTSFGKFKVNLSMGANYGKMHSIVR